MPQNPFPASFQHQVKPVHSLPPSLPPSTPPAPQSRRWWERRDRADVTLVPARGRRPVTAARRGAGARLVCAAGLPRWLRRICLVALPALACEAAHGADAAGANPGLGALLVIVLIGCHNSDKQVDTPEDNRPPLVPSTAPQSEQPGENKH